MKSILFFLFIPGAALANGPVPYYLRGTGSNQDLGGLSRNIEDITGANKDKLVSQTSQPKCASNQALFGVTVKGGYSFGGSCIAVSTATASSGSSNISVSAIPSAFMDAGTTSFGPCATGSTTTFTVTSTATITVINFIGTVKNTNGSSGLYALGFLIDGAFFDNETTTSGIANTQQNIPGGNNGIYNTGYPKQNLAAGSHSVCATITSLGGANGYTLNAGYRTWAVTY